MTAAPRFGLYLHWPFCAAKCPYCDFNSHVATEIDQSRWTRAYLREIGRIAESTGPRILSTVFLGGGTPSLMAPEAVAAILDGIRTAWPLANDLEVTLEANPTSVEAGRFRDYRAAGVNRVSLGLQALNDADLRRLGRLHSAAEGRAAWDVARATFDRASFDLIYARQDQDIDTWDAELKEALAMAAGHLSLYQLTIEEGTVFGARLARGRLPGLPDEDRAADLYELTQARTEAAGLPAYEVSNHARPGEESRHNLIYWTGGDYAGIGPGAHGRLTFGADRVATETPLAPGTWLDRVERGEPGETLRRSLDAGEQRTERLMMGLRLQEGVPEADLGTEWITRKHREIKELRELGLLRSGSGRLAVTPDGRRVLNAVIRALLD